MMIVTLELDRSFRHRIVDAINTALDNLMDVSDGDERIDDAYEALHELRDEIVEQEG